MPIRGAVCPRLQRRVNRRGLHRQPQRQLSAHRILASTSESPAAACKGIDDSMQEIMNALKEDLPAVEIKNSKCVGAQCAVTRLLCASLTS